MELDSKNVYLLAEVTWIYDNVKNDVEKGLEYLNKAKELGRDDIWLNSEIGWNLTDDSTTYDKALEYFDKDIFIKPEDSWLSYQLGSLYRKTGEIPKAIEILEIKMSLKAGELAWCYALIDEKEKAKKYLDEADSFIGMEKEKVPEIKKDFDNIKQLLQSMILLS